MKTLSTLFLLFLSLDGICQWSSPNAEGAIFYNGTISTSYGKTVILGTGSRPSFLAGTLPISSPNDFQKLKVQVYGGSWYSSDLGEATFYVATREGLQVNQQIEGGGVSHFRLRVYLNGDHYDVAIEVTQDYPAFTIRSWSLDGNAGLHELTVTQYTPAGQDVTPATINTLIASTNDGLIGIGTATPDKRLTVKGTIHTNEVLVDMNAPIQGPDYVFEKDYDLLPLADLERYITDNKHLPEVPSAKEMEKDGLNLKEMNLLLLKKVEELTLHVIAQEKNIRRIDHENQELKAQLAARK